MLNYDEEGQQYNEGNDTLKHFRVVGFVFSAGLRHFRKKLSFTGGALTIINSQHRKLC